MGAGVCGSPLLLEGECGHWDGVYPSNSLVFAASSLSISVAASSAICWICGKTGKIRALWEVMPQFKGKGVTESPFGTKLKVPIKPQQCWGNKWLFLGDPTSPQGICASVAPEL